MSQSESSSQSEKEEQVNEDGSDGDEGEDNSDNNEDSEDNDNENNEEKKHQKGKRRKLKRKKISRYFNDESVKIEIKTDRMIHDVHKYKVSFTTGEKTITRWISEKIMIEKAKDVLDKYNYRPKRIKKKKIKRIIHRQKPVDETNDVKNESLNDENTKKTIFPLPQIQIQHTKILPKTETKPKIHHIKKLEDDAKVSDQPQGHASSKPQANRQIKEVLGMKKREKSNFPDFIVKFTDSNKLERVSWKKMHEQYKINLLNYYEQNITAEGLHLSNELPEGLQLEEKLHFLQYA